MSEITVLIIGIGIGYFWAMYRKDNIQLPEITVTHQIDAAILWRKMEEWKERTR